MTTIVNSSNNYSRNENHSVLTTKHNGDLYVIYGDNSSIKKTIGSEISVYNNFISKFFARLFDKSMEIAINDKFFTVDKNSFKNHFNQLGITDVEIKEFKTLNYGTFIQQNHHRINLNQTKMSDIISDKKRKNLSIKLIKAINENKTDRALKLINKGAHFDQMTYFSNYNNYYSTKKNHVHSHTKHYSELYSRNYSSFYGMTALSLSVYRSNKIVSEFIYNAKKGCTNTDIYVTYEPNQKAYEKDNKKVLVTYENDTINFKLI
ncbi:MAG: hypothetical protein Q8K60_06740 [Parachlamydiaceae bacterium]|nr:hypothetical protein [Parachlamydiaceae bacterium]